MSIFDRWTTTQGLTKHITVFTKNKDGKYTHKTYNSLLEMPASVRMEYIIHVLSESGHEATEEFPAAQRDYVKSVVDKKLRSCR